MQGIASVTKSHNVIIRQYIVDHRSLIYENIRRGVNHPGFVSSRLTEEFRAAILRRPDNLWSSLGED